MDTREKILDAALTLFAEKGFDGVSVEKIAGAVGIKAPSLYKHFKSKQDIFEGILRKMQGDYENQVKLLKMNGSDPGQDRAVFSQVTDRQLTEMVLGLFSFFLHDPWQHRYRKLLTVEQFGSRRLSELFSAQYFDGPLGYQKETFRLLGLSGVLKQGDLEAMALQFYGPIHLLLTLCDREPEREPEALTMLRAHIRQFQRCYGRNLEEET